jgi:hypothetical protein
MPKPKAKSPRRIFTPPSPAELERRRAERERRRTERLASARPLLYPREQSAERLNCSVSTIIRLEKMGKLTRVRPGGRPTGKVYHKALQVEALASAEG